MTITKAQWEEAVKLLHMLEGQIKVLQSDIDYLTYRRIPDLERRLEDGKNNHNNR